MPIYNKDNIIYRVYKGNTPLRRIYDNDPNIESWDKREDNGLTFSLYDINYNTGKEYESGVIIDDKLLPKNDIWGNSSELPKAKFWDSEDDIETSEEDDDRLINYDYWSTSLTKQANDPSAQKVDPYDAGYAAGETIDSTYKDNYKDYNLYLDLRKSDKRRRGIRKVAIKAYGRTPEEALQRATDLAVLPEDEGGYGTSGIYLGYDTPTIVNITPDMYRELFGEDPPIKDNYEDTE